MLLILAGLHFECNVDKKKNYCAHVSLDKQLMFKLMEFDLIEHVS